MTQVCTHVHTPTHPHTHTHTHCIYFLSHVLSRKRNKHSICIVLYIAVALPDDVTIPPVSRFHAARVVAAWEGGELETAAQSAQTAGYSSTLSLLLD